MDGSDRERVNESKREREMARKKENESKKVGCDEEKIKKFIKSVLSQIALSNTLIKTRLETLTK